MAICLLYVATFVFARIALNYNLLDKKIEEKTRKLCFVRTAAVDSDKDMFTFRWKFFCCLFFWQDSLSFPLSPPSFLGPFTLFTSVERSSCIYRIFCELHCLLKNFLYFLSLWALFSLSLMWIFRLIKIALKTSVNIILNEFRLAACITIYSKKHYYFKKHFSKYLKFPMIEKKQDNFCCLYSCLYRLLSCPAKP